MGNKTNVYRMVIIGVMSAVICILGPLSIPIGVVPITFTNLAIYFSLYALGMKKGTMSYIIYIFIGFIGLPVFSGFGGGPSKIIGPTGGYLIGFIFMALISGIFIDKYFDRWYICFIGMVLGISLCYVFGSIWLSYQAKISVSHAFTIGVFPFIPGDLIKVLIATFTGPIIRKRLIKINLFQA